MTTWGDMLLIIRRSQLKDEVEEDGDSAEATWSNDQLHDAYCWAQREFAAHTALLKTTSIVDGSIKTEGEGEDPDVLWDFSTETEFPLPSDWYEPVDQSGIVCIIDADGNRTYLDPVFFTSEHSPYADNQGYWMSPDGILHLNEAPGASTTLEIRYYAYWPEPDDGEDEEFVLTVPRWSLAALAYLSAAHCMAAPGNASANIRQWNTRDDSGRPQDSALIAQANWLVERAYQLMAAHYKQDRANFNRAIR